jgi:hypothetical protein
VVFLVPLGIRSFQPRKTRNRQKKGLRATVERSNRADTGTGEFQKCVTLHIFEFVPSGVEITGAPIGSDCGWISKSDAVVGF